MALEDVLAGAVVRPVYIGFFDFVSDPVRGWTGPGTFLPTGTGDALLDGETFLEAAGIVAASEFSNGLGIGQPVQLTFTTGDDGGDVFDQLVVDRRAFLGRRAVVWRAFLNSDESGVLSYIDRIFGGYMASASVTREDTGLVSITLSLDQDTQKAKLPPLRWIDHQNFYPTDTASTFINNLSRGGVAGSAAAPSGPIYPIPGIHYDDWGPPQ